MLQVIEELLRISEDKTTLALVFGNVTEADILLRDRLDELASKHPRFTVTYILDRPPAQWSGSSGFISADLLREKLAPPSADVLVLVCGPPGMVSAISGPKAKDWTQGEVGGLLKELGYTAEMVFKF
jgi:cytochrome-b5 reductase